LDLATEGLILLERAFSERFLDERPWVFLAVKMSPELESVVQLVRRLGLWLSVASDPEVSNVFWPALAGEEPFRVAVSTGGSSPALAARVAKELRQAYHGYGVFCRLLRRLRPLALGAGLPETERRRIFQALAQDLELPALAGSGRADLLRKRLQELLAPVELPEDFLL
jgi:siroheme synthase (precorrin-2 oxidase/ferrochelatase)